MRVMGLPRAVSCTLGSSTCPLLSTHQASTASAIIARANIQGSRVAPKSHNPINA